MQPLQQLSYSLDNIEIAVSHFWKSVSQYHLLAFSGDMGAGKTTFIHKLCDYLQVNDVVSSPTFALINEYHFTDLQGIDNTIYHMDWYRLRSTQEAMDAGMEDCIDQAKQKNVYCFIEWPEKATELLTLPHVWIDIEAKNRTEREMKITLVSG